MCYSYVRSTTAASSLASEAEQLWTAVGKGEEGIVLVAQWLK